MDQATILTEVERLSPWYYSFDLRGVRTDGGAPCDHHGHRAAPTLPPHAKRFLYGKTVLDAACNEGGYTFAALDCGARSVDGFDVRAVNIEKARLVAGILGHDAATFQTASCDEWTARSQKTYDYVFLCGLLYHLEDPARTIAEFCRKAREGVFVTCVLHGGDGGYTAFPEQENIAASASARTSMMPNSTRTLIDEFSRHGFRPRYVAENRSGLYWGGCTLFLARCQNSDWGLATSTSSRLATGGVEVFLSPAYERLDESTVAMDISAYNWTGQLREVEGRLAVRDRHGILASQLGPLYLELPPRVVADDGSFSQSVSFPVGVDLDESIGRVTIEASLHDPGDGRTIASSALRRHG